MSGWISVSKASRAPSRASSTSASSLVNGTCISNMTVLDCDSSPGWPASCEDRHPDCLAADLVDASRHLLIARVSCPTRHPREPGPRRNSVIAGLAVLRRLIHATSPLFVYWARRATRPGRPGSVRCSFGVPDPPLVQRGLGIALRRVLPNLLAAARSDVEVGDG